MRRQPAVSTGLGLAVLSSATFGTSGAFAASLLQAGWTPGAAVTARLVTAALVLTVPAVLALRGSRRLWRRDLRSVAVYGVVAVAGAQLAYFNAVQRLPVAIALLLEYSGVLLVVAWLWLRTGQRPRRLTVAGAGVALGGLALVLDLFGSAAFDPVGVLWGLAAAVGLASYFVLSAGTDDALPPVVLAWGGLAVGGATVFVAGAFGLVALDAPRTAVVLLDRQVSWLVPVLGLSVVAAAVAYLAGIAATRLLGAKIASFVGLTEVLFAVAFAWLLLDQTVAAVQLAGGALVVAGIAMVRIDELRSPAVAAPAPAGPAVATHEQLVLAAEPSCR